MITVTCYSWSQDSKDY